LIVERVEFAQGWNVKAKATKVVSYLVGCQQVNQIMFFLAKFRFFSLNLLLTLGLKSDKLGTISEFKKIAT
jgi:hypothetical protein